MRNKQIKKLDKLGVSGTLARELLGKDLNKEGKKALRHLAREHKLMAHRLMVLHNSIPE